MHNRPVYRRKAHSVSLLHAHLVFCVKYRRPVLTARVAREIRLSMLESGAGLAIDITAIEADRDHLHLMIAYPPDLALGAVARRLKGASSRAVRKRSFPEVTSRLWGPAFWFPSYFVASCGGAPLAVVKAYVEGQQDPDRKRRRKL